MVSLRDCFEKDFTTFFNTDEFAEIHNVEGKDIPIVIDEDLLEEKKLKYSGEGLFRGEVLFHVAKNQFGKKPMADRRLRLDKVNYRIVEVNESESMYTITLERLNS